MSSTLRALNQSALPATCEMELREQFAHSSNGRSGIACALTTVDCADPVHHSASMILVCHLFPIAAQQTEEML